MNIMLADSVLIAGIAIQALSAPHLPDFRQRIFA
jgi:hypothetical protein